MRRDTLETLREIREKYEENPKEIDSWDVQTIVENFPKMLDFVDFVEKILDTPLNKDGGINISQDMFEDMYYAYREIKNKGILV